MKVTPTLRAEFERRRLAGESCFEISLDHDVSPSTVDYHTRHLGVIARMGMERSFDYAKAAKMVEHADIELVAQHFGVKKYSIYRALRVERRGYA